MEGVAAVRRMVRGDAAGVFAVQVECAGLAQWGLREYDELAERGIVGWVAVYGSSGDSISGFLTARLVVDEMEILNLGVRVEARRRGVGRALVEAAFVWGAANGGRRAFLEVRASNAGAIAFYERFGFAAGGRRAGYYSAPVEDAVQLAAGIG